MEILFGGVAASRTGNFRRFAALLLQRGMAPLGDPNLGQADQTEEMVHRHIAKLLRNRRKHLGLTQVQIGARVGVRFQQIQKYECAANRVSAARLWHLAEALHVTTSYFFDGLTTAAPDRT